MGNGRLRTVATCASAAAAALLAGIVLAGCGTSSASTAASTATGTTATGSGSTGSGAFQACLKAHGVTQSFGPGGAGGARPGGANGGPPPGGGGRPNLTAKQRAAVQACRSLRPAGGRRPGGAPGGAGGAAFQKYTNCLKQHGVTFGSGTANSTKFQAAQKACASLNPATATTKTTTG
jgi:hypothetical protein